MFSNEYHEIIFACHVKCVQMFNRSNTFERKLFSKDNIIVAQNIRGFFEI